jgi:hypothetical protein
MRRDAKGQTVERFHTPKGNPQPFSLEKNRRALITVCSIRNVTQTRLTSLVLYSLSFLKPTILHHSMTPILQAFCLYSLTCSSAEFMSIVVFLFR